MSDTLNHNITGLTYEDTLPLRWVAATSALSETQQIRIQESNAEVLRTVAALEEHQGEAVSEHDSATQELQRMEFKINLLLDLMGQVLAHHATLPDPLPVSLSAQAIQWDAQAAPDVGSYLNVELFLSRKYPRSIMFYGQVQQVSNVQGIFRITMAPEGMSEVVRDWLEKFIFRHHRRSIAHARRG